MLYLADSLITNIMGGICIVLLLSIFISMMYFYYVMKKVEKIIKTYKANLTVGSICKNAVKGTLGTVKKVFKKIGKVKIFD